MGFGHKRKEAGTPHAVADSEIASLSAKLVDALSIELLDVVLEAAAHYRARLMRFVRASGPSRPLRSPKKFH